MSRLPPPSLQFFADLSVRVAAPQEIGITPGGKRRVIPILGGDVKGDGWAARILPGGADFQLGLRRVEDSNGGHFVLETDGGDLVFVQGHSLRVAPPEVTAKLVRGEPVDPASIYFRCNPRLETSSATLKWVNERIFVGAGVRHPAQVVMRFFTLL